MTDTIIPREALEALAMIIYDITGEGIDMDEARIACRAMLKAWPGMEHQTPDGWSNKPHIILPLPKENSND